MHSRFSSRSYLAILIAALALAGCAAPPGPAASAPTIEPPTATPAAPTFTTVPPAFTALPPTVTALPPTATAVPPTATAVPPTATPLPPTSTVTPTAAPTSTPAKASAAPNARPDPKADPLGALRYASVPGRMKSATFTYDMKITMKAADDASAQALGAAAQQQTTIGSGAFQVVDAAANKVNTRMAMTVTSAGKTTTVETTAIGDVYWLCMAETGCLKLPGGNAAKTGVDPAQMVKLLSVASNPQWVDDKPLNGEAVHHLRYQVKREDAAQLISGLVQDAWKDLVKEMTVQVDVWLAAKDLVPRQMTETIGMLIAIPDPAVKMRGDTVMTIRYDKINQPVKIEAPAEATS